MELEEYLQNNNVTLWRNNRVLGPQQTKSLADFDYAEGLETLRERWFGFATIEQTQTQPKNQFVELSPLRWW